MNGVQYVECMDCGEQYPRGKGLSFCPHKVSVFGGGNDSDGVDGAIAGTILRKPQQSKPPSAIATQVDGTHYKQLGHYQPWEVLLRWLTVEEFRGFMKGTAIAYLARERRKGGRQDIEKAMHTLQGYLELTEGEEAGGESTTQTAQPQEGTKDAFQRDLGKFTGLDADKRRV